MCYRTHPLDKVLPSTAPPPSAATDGGQIGTGSRLTLWCERYVAPWKKWLGGLYAVFLCFLVVYFGWTIWHNEYNPSFVVKSVSISTNKLDGNSNISQVVWNLEISIKNRNIGSGFRFKVLDVWMPEGLKATTVTGLPFVQGPENTTSVNASRIAYLPSGTIQELMKSEFNITLLAKYEECIIAEIVCEDLRVSLSSDAEKGTMVGGPKSCLRDRFYSALSPCLKPE